MIDPVTLVETNPQPTKTKTMPIEQAVGYLQHGNDDIQQLALSYVLLWEAVRDSFYLGRLDPADLARFADLCNFPSVEE